MAQMRKGKNIGTNYIKTAGGRNQIYDWTKILCSGSLLWALEGCLQVYSAPYRHMQQGSREHAFTFRCVRWSNILLRLDGCEAEHPAPFPETLSTGQGWGWSGIISIVTPPAPPKHGPW